MGQPRIRLAIDVTVVTDPMGFAGNFVLWVTVGLFLAYALGVWR